MPLPPSSSRAVLFGILILLVALAMLACWYMTWPKTAALLVALLWLSIAIIMLLGTGECRVQSAVQHEEEGMGEISGKHAPGC
jgi:uncharacterized SAM-binding protein YcdF (DUF218 family)